MKQTLIGILFCCAVSSAAQAQQPLFNWSGAYVGISGGYQIVGNNFSTDLTDAESHGPLIGGLVGFDRQSGHWVYGGVADLYWANIKGDQQIGSVNDSVTTIQGLGSIRGRAGVANGPTLWYGTAGIAFARVKGEHDYTKGFGAPTFVTSTNYSLGIIAGVGVEHQFARQWSWNMEYLYMFLENNESTGAFSGRSEADGHIARFALIYRLGP